MPTRFEVNISSILAGADRIGGIARSRLQEFEKEAQRLAPSLLLSVLDEAFQIANADGGFPIEYQEHVLQVAARVPFDINIGGGTIVMETDLEYYLGDEYDRRRAYHQGAREPDGTLIWGPYEGQSLKNDDPEKRHVYWEALQQGLEKVDIYNEETGKVDNVHISNAAAQWADTKAQYIRIWGNKAPEWTFIQWGQEEWAPYVYQFDIVGKLEETLDYELTRLLVNIVDEEVAIANSYEASGLTVGFTSKGSARLTSPLATIGGRVYRKGQFVPKNPDLTDYDINNF